jgi:hypothetical protein
MNYSLHYPSSGNKVSSIYRTYSHKETCPNTCPLKNGGGCYAENFHTNLHWQKLTDGERGLNWSAFIEAVEDIPRRSIIRHNIAGDLPHDNGVINSAKQKELTRAMTSRNKKPFTYTHHKLTEHNTAEIKRANQSGFTINISANNPREAVRIKRDTGLPVVTVLPMNAPNVQTIDGVKIVACPAEKSKRVNCGNCQHSFCGSRDRDFIVGFRSHGSKKKKADIIASSTA